METIEINGKVYQLDVEKAKELELLKEKDSKPRSWEEYKTAWVMPDDDVNYASYYNSYDSLAYDIFNSEEEARAFCALGKLIQVRDAWWGKWKPDWDKDYTKYTIINIRGHIKLNTATFNSGTLAFPTKEMANDFLNTFRDLIEEAKMFL